LSSALATPESFSSMLCKATLCIATNTWPMPTAISNSLGSTLPSHVLLMSNCAK